VYRRGRWYAITVAVVTWLVAAPVARADEQVAESAYENFGLTADRAGQWLFDAPLECFTCSPVGIFQKRNAVHVRQLDGDGEPGVKAAQATTQVTATVGRGRIVIANGDGSARRVLGSGNGSFVSPDGSRVAVTDSDETSSGARNPRLELFASTGGTPAHVLAIGCYGIYWSPDSTKLACVDSAPELDRLLVIDAASGAMTTLAAGHIGSQVSFSPESTQLAYTQDAGSFSPRGGALKVIDLATRAIATLRRRAAAPVWGPRAIAFSTVKPSARVGRIHNVAVVKPDGGGFRRLTRFRPRFFQTGLSPVAWSANGRRLLAGLFGQDTRVAYAVNPRRGGARPLGTRVTPSALSRDGRFVIGSTDTESFDPSRSNVVRVPWAGGRPRVLLRRADDPSFNG
jgi:hypothetical protein